MASTDSVTLPSPLFRRNKACLGTASASSIPHLAFNKLPPPVLIEQITADHKTYDASLAANGRFPLPALVRDLEIDYTALTLVAPEKSFSATSWRVRTAIGRTPPIAGKLSISEVSSIDVPMRNPGDSNDHRTQV